MWNHKIWPISKHKSRESLEIFENPWKIVQKSRKNDFQAQISWILERRRNRYFQAQISRKYLEKVPKRCRSAENVLNSLKTCFEKNFRFFQKPHKCVRYDGYYKDMNSFRPLSRSQPAQAESIEILVLKLFMQSECFLKGKKKNPKNTKPWRRRRQQRLKGRPGCREAATRPPFQSIKPYNVKKCNISKIKMGSNSPLIWGARYTSCQDGTHSKHFLELF